MYRNFGSCFGRGQPPLSNMSSLHQIAFLSPGLGLGGGEQVVKELCLSLLNNPAIRIALLTRPESCLFRDQALRNTIEMVPVELITFRENWRKALVGLSTIASWARIHQGAVFYGHTFQSIKYLAWISRLTGVKTVCHLHESEYRHYYTRRARWLSLQIDHFIAISQHVKHEFMKGTGISSERVSVIPNGVTIGQYPNKSTEKRKAMCREYGINPDHNLIIMVARMDLLKGHTILASAAKDIIALFPETTFLFVGAESETEDQRRIIADIWNIARKNGIEDHIKLVGWVSNVRDLMRYADVAVIPSIQEGFGRTVIEAMAEGTPVVASRVGGMAEIFEAPQEGIYVPSLSPEMLSKEISNLLGTATGRERLARNGFARVRSTYDISIISSRIAAVLEEVSKKNEWGAKR